MKEKFIILKEGDAGSKRVSFDKIPKSITVTYHYENCSVKTVEIRLRQSFASKLPGVHPIPRTEDKILQSGVLMLIDQSWDEREIADLHIVVCLCKDQKPESGWKVYADTELEF